MVSGLFGFWLGGRSAHKGRVQENPLFSPGLGLQTRIKEAKMSSPVVQAEGLTASSRSTMNSSVSNETSLDL